MLLQASPSKSQIQHLQSHTALGCSIAAVGEGLPGATGMVEVCPGTVGLALCLFYRWNPHEQGMLGLQSAQPLCPEAAQSVPLVQLHILSWGCRAMGELELCLGQAVWGSPCSVQQCLSLTQLLLSQLKVLPRYQTDSTKGITAFGNARAQRYGEAVAVLDASCWQKSTLSAAFFLYDFLDVLKLQQKIHP